MMKGLAYFLKSEDVLFQYLQILQKEQGEIVKNEFYQFLGIAFGSIYELQTQLQFLIDLNFISETKIVPLKALLAEIQKMIYSLKTSLKL